MSTYFTNLMILNFVISFLITLGISRGHGNQSLTFKVSIGLVDFLISFFLLLVAEFILWVTIQLFYTIVSALW